MITELHAYKYRCFQKLKACLGKYQVLVGANGAGKSTLLDLVDVFAEIGQTRKIQDVFTGVNTVRVKPRTAVLDELIYEKQGDYFGLAIEVALPSFISNKIISKIEMKDITKTAAELLNEEKRWPGYIRYELQLSLFNDLLQISGEYLTILPRDRSLWENLSTGMIGIEDFSRKPYIIPVISRTAGTGNDAQVQLFSEITGKSKKKSSLKLPSDTLALSSVPADPSLYETTLWFIDFLRDETCAYRPNHQKMREASKPQEKALKLLPDAGNIAWLIYELQEDKETHAEWCEHIRIALPTINTIRAATRPNDNFAYFEVEYKSGLTVSSMSVSEGTLSIIAYTILPFLPNHRLPGHITIEEPENGIHPRGIEAILEAISSVKGSHVWVTSHSPIVVAHTDPENLLCLSATSEGVNAIPGREHPKLKAWKGTPGLETLFGAGVLS